MSWETSTYVLGVTVGDATRKLVLLGFSNHAHKDGTAAFPSLLTIAEYAECSKRTVQRHVKHLVENGFMREGDQQLVAHYDARRRPIVYDIAMDEATKEEWAAHHAAGANTLREAAVARGNMRTANQQVSGGDNLSRQSVASNPEVSRRDDLSRQGEESWGDTGDAAGVTDQASWGVTGVTQTTQEPSKGTSQTTSAVADAPSTDADSKAKVELTDAELETGFDAEGKPLKGKKLDALAQSVTCAWWEWIEDNGHAKPAQSFLACRGVVRAALGNSVPPKSIKHALARITTEGRAVSGASLQIAMGGNPNQAGLRRGYDDVARWGEDTEPDGEMSDEEVDAMFHGTRTRPGDREAGTA